MEVISVFGFQAASTQKLPLYRTVQAGYPTVADSDVEVKIDLIEYLVDHPASTFFAHVSESNLTECGIADGDILIVDTSIAPVNGRIVLVSVNNELSVKLYRKIDQIEYLQTDNQRVLPIKIEPYLEFTIIGTVTKVIHSL